MATNEGFRMTKLEQLKKSMDKAKEKFDNTGTKDLAGRYMGDKCRRHSISNWHRIENKMLKVYIEAQREYEAEFYRLERIKDHPCKK